VCVCVCVCVCECVCEKGERERVCVSVWGRSRVVALTTLSSSPSFSYMLFCVCVCSFKLHRCATNYTTVRPSQTQEIPFTFQFAHDVLCCTHTGLTVVIPVLDRWMSVICSCLKVCVWFVTSSFLHTQLCVQIVHTVVCYSCSCSYCGHCGDCCLSVCTVIILCFWLCSGTSG